MTITSTDNPRVKAIAKLKSARERRRTGLFLIEGHRELQRAASAGIAIETLVVCDDLLGDDITPDVDDEVLHVGRQPQCVAWQYGRIRPASSASPNSSTRPWAIWCFRRTHCCW